ncbi:hypothetical protein BKA70DRAFT_854688 [Coprinopsis sp. MPI-PUGE-AT-0042]|nr:hypothetical protein BKA70DRAFT_854688 [Coprinopsis sp. MPI-PUGE-AT-0042]
MSSIVELVPFSVGQGKDFDGLRSTLESVGNANGSLKVFHGIQIEDKTVGYLALVWNSEEALANWTGRDSFEAKSREIIGEPSGPRLKLHVSEVSSSVSGAFEAPVTEFAFAKLKSEANREEYNATSTVLGSRLRGQKGSGYSPALDQRQGERRWMLLLSLVGIVQRPI